MTIELSPEGYAKHAVIPISTVWDIINGRASVLFDPRDIRPVHGRLWLIAVNGPNAAGKGARPQFIPNPAYTYKRKRPLKGARAGSVHVAGGAAPVEVVPQEDGGAWRVAHPAGEHVDGDVPLGVVGREGMAEGLQVHHGKAA